MEFVKTCFITLTDHLNKGVQIETILQEKRPFTTPCMFVSLPASSNVETCKTSTFSASMTRFLLLLMLAILGCSGFLNCEHGDFSILMSFMIAISWVVVVVILINMSFHHLVTDQEKECHGCQDEC
jgi:hypothetical protein